ncbi:cache domain-containing protein [Shewanella putrefaciens]|uniref:histidine kinase n=2 Tax=Shewanella putrefaciens TaxID=24 RepID=E6XPD4_SHEP2|nr:MULTISPECIES: cache domain-containing protein [Shewanella]CAD6364638.1 Adaptive-response sensory-kinase SasA [Shewanella hafniensis]ABM22929.1 integral membrane sensor signal transduction histidine kinase [Shewanella sp. W3-18-1]AVV84452.1 sensor histidine kinase [Shewanella putrefaciens]MCA1898496.1 cache domain-containing protein [Shewanella putrefaciens]MCT8944530.1 cache domain-containing protein [Shewanella putrefaciens]
MSFFTHFFGVSWQQMQAKVRYRILILTLLPILLTLVSLVFITIYWNISYTGKQLFMKVKADLAVAENTLQQVQVRQEKQLEKVMTSWTFQNDFRPILNGEMNHRANIDAFLNEQKQLLNLDYLRLVSVSEAATDPDLRLILPKMGGLLPYSGLMVLSPERLARIDPELAVTASIPIVATLRAQNPDKGVEGRGLLSRSLLPVPDLAGKVAWYLDGGILFNRDTRIVDHIRDLVYDKGTLPERSIGTVTIFLDNIRISTNVPLHFFPQGNETQGRALGSLVSEEVREKVLNRGELWVDRAFVFNDWFISAYAPLEDIRGQRVGMIYTGFSESPFIHNYLLNIIELGTILMLVLLVSGLLVYRGAYSLLLPIERIHHVVQAVQSGRNIRIGALGLDRENELSNLAEQFDRMLDLLQRRNAQIQSAAEQLEMKVEERTRSLQDKTLELERNVALLNETRQQLVTNEKLTALGELTAGIAHEINNPTAVILGNMELMRYELGDNADLVKEEIDLVIQQVMRISTIIRSLLQYSRPGEFNAPLEMQSITPIIEETMVLVRHSIKKQEVILITELSATCLVQVNRPQLLQVLINLVVNAAHAMDGKGRIWVRTYDWLQQDVPIGVKIEVEDEGSGIAPELLGRIFDPFYTTRKDGTGLGLSLSYGIIKRIGGTIEVSSTLGKGTVFTIGLYHEAKEEQENNPYDGLHFSGSEI